MLGGDPNITAPASTDMLYSGEQFDPGLQINYHRARYYDMSAGIWYRLDPFGGNHSDPQSLHKYAYCHGDPVNGIDPSGLFNLATVLESVWIRGFLTGAFFGAIEGFFKSSGKGKGFWGVLAGIAKGVLISGLVGMFSGGLGSKINIVGPSFSGMQIVALEIVESVIKGLITGGGSVVNAVLMGTAFDEKPNLLLSFWTSFAAGFFYNAFLSPDPDMFSKIAVELAEAGFISTIATGTTALIEVISVLIRLFKREYYSNQNDGQEAE